MFRFIRLAFVTNDVNKTIFTPAVCFSGSTPLVSGNFHRSGVLFCTDFAKKTDLIVSAVNGGRWSARINHGVWKTTGVDFQANFNVSLPGVTTRRNNYTRYTRASASNFTVHDVAFRLHSFSDCSITPGLYPAERFSLKFIRNVDTLFHAGYIAPFVPRCEILVGDRIIHSQTRLDRISPLLD